MEARMRVPRRKPWLFAPVLLAAAAAALAAPSAPRTAVDECTPGSDWPAARPALADAVLAAVNAHRAQVGARPLAVSPALQAAAVWKARHMAKYGYMNHDDPAPPVARTVSQRITACGYAGSGWGENIAYGYPTAQAVMQGWLSSPGHRANIEQPGFASTGVAAAAAPNGVVYWAQSFGTSTVAAAPPASPPAASAPAPERRPARATVLAVGRSLDRHALKGDRRFTLRFPVVQTHNRRHVTRGAVACQARVAGRRLAVLASGFHRGYAQCVLVTPRGVRGRHVVGTLRIAAAPGQGQRWFSRLVR
jgi:uncharacterized protein YkwD